MEKPRRGRPSLGELPYYFRIAWAEWLDGLAEMYRDAGSNKPKVEAAIEGYEYKYGRPRRAADGKLYTDDGRRAPEIEKFLRTNKKKWSAGRQELEQFKARKRLVWGPTPNV
jgi:hypothetical protein